MKRLMMSLVLMVTIAASAAAMSFSKARKEALFLSDKMAYELNLSLSQYEAVYEINLDYMLGLYDMTDLDGVFWMRRNSDLRHVLTMWQWDRYCQIADFYRPMVWVSRHTFTLSLRSRYVDKHFFYYERPSIYSSYRGGHNSGNVSFYQGRDFHRPENQVGPQHYGSSTPAPQGSGRPKGNNNNKPSYSIGTPSSNGPSGNNSGSVRGRADGGNGARSQGTMNNGSSSRSGSTTTTDTNSGSSRGNNSSGSSRGNNGSSRGGGNSGGGRGGR